MVEVVVVLELEVVDVEVVDCSGMVGSDIGNVVWGTEEVVDSATVVVDTSLVVVDSSVVVVDSSVVVEATGLVLKASSGTISQLPSSIFQANIRHDDPPFSYINNSSGTLAA